MGQVGESLVERKPFEGKHARLVEDIMRVFYQVYRELGFGFSREGLSNSLSNCPP